MENNLIIIRADHEKNYKVIDLTCVQDEKLSWKAKGIFNYFVTRPPHWSIKIADLFKKSKDGMNSLNSGIKELIEAGYLFRIVKKDNKGMFTNWAYLTKEIPCSDKEIIPFIPEGYKLHSKNPLMDNPFMGDPLMGNPSSYNNKNINNKSSKDDYKDISNKPSKDGLMTSDEVVQSDVNNLSGKVRKRYKEDMTAYSPDVQNLYELWMSLGSPIKRHKNGSKANHNALCALKKAVKKFPSDKIGDAMLLYHKVINSAQDYKLNIRAPGHLVGLDEFFGFDDFTLTRIDNKNIAYGIQSWFEECSKGELYMERVYGKHKVEDEQPEITTALKKYWKEYISKEVPHSPGDEDCFRLAAKRFKEFMKKNRNNVALYDNIDINKLPRDSKYLYEAIITVTEELHKVTPAWLCSDNMFRKRLPIYLIDQGMMDNEYDDIERDNSGLVNQLYNMYGG
jgi:hypothetical protein